MAPPGAPASASLPKHDLAAAERAADGKLRTCRRVAVAIDEVVDRLSGAGSGLQKTLSDALGGPEGLEQALASEDPLIQRAAHSAFVACGGIGAALTGLAAALSGDLQQPLKDLERAVHADRVQRAEELERLRRKHQACTGALTESLRRKERLSSDLKVALDEVEHEKHGIRFPWLGKSHQDQTESRLQKAMVMQTAAVEEFSECVEQAMEVTSSAQQETEALADVLVHVDFAVKQTLRTSLRRCSGAWRAIAGTLMAAAQQLSDDSSHIVPEVPPPVKVGKRPSWANGIFKPLSIPGGTDGGADSAHPKTGGGKLADAKPQILEQLIQGAPSPARNLPEPEGARAQAEAPEPRDQKLREGWAELEAQRRAFRESHEAREIQLLEQEENLRGMQAQLDSQMQHVAECRRNLAMNQARCIAWLESPKVGNHAHTGPEYIKMDSGKRVPLRSPTQSFNLDGKARGVPPLGGDESGSEAEEKGAADAVWDMDWTLARSLSGKVLEKEAEVEELSSTPTVSTTVDATSVSAQDTPPASTLPKTEELSASSSVAAASDATVATTQVGPASEASSEKQTLPAESPELGTAAAAAQDGDLASANRDVAGVPFVQERHSDRGDSASAAEDTPRGPPSVCSSSATVSPREDNSQGPATSSVPAQPSLPIKRSRLRPSARPSDEEDAGSQGGGSEFQALREKMQRKRNGRELSPSPRTSNKGRMPGVNMEIAMKLEARRKLVDAMEASPDASL